MSVKGCFTDFHIDFGGTSVWYHVFRGGKVGKPCLFLFLCTSYGGEGLFSFIYLLFLFFFGGWKGLVSDQSISPGFVDVQGVC